MGGMPGGCSCGEAQYCRAGTCFDCDDLSQLDFDAREEILAHPSGNLRFPRPGPDAGSLFFTLTTATVSELWYEPSVADPPGGSLGGSPTPARSGLFYSEDTANLGFNALFDEVLANEHRSLRRASFDGSALGDAADAPPPLAPGAFDDFSATLASGTRRAYWMSTRGGAPSLRTGVIGESAATPVTLRLAAHDAPGVSCPATFGDATPWVNASGTLLVVSAAPVDASCAPVDAQATDLFVAPVDPSTGKPLVAAIALNGVNVSSGASNETDAAFSSDLCTLYFASDGGSAGGFDYRLFRAHRR
jgi:hypothetical protein